MTRPHFRTPLFGCLAIALYGASVAAAPASGPAASRRILSGMSHPSNFAPSGGSASAREYLVYFGTYTGPKSKGIYVSRMDAATGHLSEPELVAETPNPSFVAIHPNHRYLYAVNEVANFNGSSGSVTAYAIDAKTGHLKQLNQQSSEGGGPCFVTVDKSGRDALVANYGTGSVAALPIHRDGSLAKATAAIQHHGSSVDTQRQEGPHAHSINVSADDRFAFAADLGLDKILVYRFDAGKGTLTPNDPPSTNVEAGSGPRHFAFHPSGRYAYVINEMASTVTAFHYDPNAGTLTSFQTISTLPAGFHGNTSCAEVQVHPSGKFLYGSNRGHDSIAMFRIDEKTGRLTAAGHQPTGGKTPRNFGVDPAGHFLLAANQDSDTVNVFRINQETGQLTPTGQVLSVPMPVCVKMMPAGR